MMLYLGTVNDPRLRHPSHPESVFVNHRLYEVFDQIRSDQIVDLMHHLGPASIQHGASHRVGEVQELNRAPSASTASVLFSSRKIYCSHVELGDMRTRPSPKQTR
jgi:hypothetical protein